MWLATQYGFYSIVQKENGQYHVRSRIQKDLENLIALASQDHKIHRWEGADYRYRIIVEQGDFVEIMGRLALSLDYPNFKNQIARTNDQRDKLHAFHEIWAIMAAFQNRPGTRDQGSD